MTWCASDPDAWMDDVPPEWEPEACEHPMYRMALRDYQLTGIRRDWWEPQRA